MKTMSKILVTGGTGLVGAHLLYYLTKDGYHPIAIKRTNSNILNVKKIFSYYSNEHNTLFEQITWKECDIIDVLTLEDIIKDSVEIYHCAALISFNNNDKNEMINVNTTGTANVIDLALKHNIKRLCYVSSIATLGSNNNLPLDENCIWDWTNKSGYAISKHLAEMEVWRGFAEGLNGVIVNPSLIIGPGSWESGIGTIINRSQSGLPFYPPGSCGVIDVKDLTEIMIKLMKTNISNERFIINSDHITYKDLMRIVAKSLNKKPPYIRLRPFIMKFFIFLDIIWNTVRGKRIELSTDAVKYTTQEIRLNSKKINDNIKHHYRNIETTLIECINLFVND
ncbi:MAG: NAD-dependent epimerase [Flavobacteriales bacterium]|nr:NAD-dependent epimerase [Flavobacteriales bacterium]|tara:strand:+ start:1846 stop:2859 length:1014 start_codon:yes stop_codon:yes gene_type:complete